MSDFYFEDTYSIAYNPEVERTIWKEHPNERLQRSGMLFHMLTHIFRTFWKSLLKKGLFSKSRKYIWSFRAVWKCILKRNFFIKSKVFFLFSQLSESLFRTKKDLFKTFDVFFIFSGLSENPFSKDTFSKIPTSFLFFPDFLKSPFWKGTFSKSPSFPFIVSDFLRVSFQNGLFRKSGKNKKDVRLFEQVFFLF